MPFQMDYTDPVATNHPNSYWVVGAISSLPTIKTGSVIFFGYHDKASFDAGDGQLAGSPRAFTCNDPSIFDQYFRKSDVIASGLSFTGWMESFALNDSGDPFFATALPLSPVDPLSLEIGLFDQTKLRVNFEDVIDAADYSLGVTVRVNGTPVTIASSSRIGTTVIEHIIPAVDANDVVDWSYDNSIGVLVDDTSLALESFNQKAVVNSVGSYLRFNFPEDSGWLAAAM
jgi:hypothetical protein